MSKAMQRALGVQLGLEDGDDTPELSEAASENAAISEGAIEVADATDEVVADDTAATELSEAHEKLEEVSGAIAEASENGGISKEAAVFAHLAIKNACGRFYGPAFASAVPSVESFTGDSGRRRNTQITLEGVGQMLRSFWDAIVRQIKKMYASVKNWFQKVLGAAAGIKKKADSLDQRASGLSGTADEKTMDLGLMKALHIAGKAPTPEQAKQLITGMTKAADELLGTKTSGEYENIHEKFEALVETVADITDAEAEAAKSLTALYHSKTLNGTTDNLRSELSKFANNGKRSVTGIGIGSAVANTADRFGAAAEVDVTGTGELFGGRAIVIRDLKKGAFKAGNGADLLTIARTARYGAPAIEEYLAKPKEVDSSGTFKTLSPADMRTICSEISDAMDHVRTYEKAWAMRDKQSDKIEKAGKKAIETVEKDKDAKPMKIRAVKDVASGMAAFFQNGLRFETAFMNGLMNDSRALLSWVERSMAQYK